MKKNKLIQSILSLLIVLMLTGCGSEGEKGKEDSDGDTTTPAVSYDCGNVDIPFYASGSVGFDIEYPSETYYTFDLIRSSDGQSLSFLAPGKGPTSAYVVKILALGEYRLSVMGECAWSVDIYGNAWEYSGSSPGDCDCEGCCAANGGVICRNGVTMCMDGTPLSDTCMEQGCVAEGCSGCE